MNLALLLIPVACADSDTPEESRGLVEVSGYVETIFDQESHRPTQLNLISNETSMMLTILPSATFEIDRERLAEGGAEYNLSLMNYLSQGYDDPALMRALHGQGVAATGHMSTYGTLQATSIRWQGRHSEYPEVWGLTLDRGKFAEIGLVLDAGTSQVANQMLETIKASLGTTSLPVPLSSLPDGFRPSAIGEIEVTLDGLPKPIALKAIAHVEKWSEGAPTRDDVFAVLILDNKPMQADGPSGRR